MPVSPLSKGGRVALAAKHATSASLGLQLAIGLEVFQAALCNAYLIHAYPAATLAKPNPNTEHEEVISETAAVMAPVSQHTDLCQAQQHLCDILSAAITYLAGQQGCRAPMAAVAGSLQPLICEMGTCMHKKICQQFKCILHAVSSITLFGQCPAHRKDSCEAMAERELFSTVSIFMTAIPELQITSWRLGLLERVQCTLNLEESRCHLQAIDLLGFSLAARLSLETVDAVLSVQGTAGTQPKTNLQPEGQAVSTLRAAVAALCYPKTQCFTGSAGIRATMQLATGLLFLPNQTALPKQLWLCTLCLARSVIGLPVSDAEQEADSSVHALATALGPTTRAGKQPTADDTSAAVQYLVLLTIRFISQTEANAVLREDQQFLTMLFDSSVFCIKKLSSHRLAGVLTMSTACLAQQCASYESTFDMDVMEEPAMIKEITTALQSDIMAELLGSAVQGPSSATALRAQCKTRLCGRVPPSTQELAELTVLLKGWYLTDAWLHQAGIHHKRLTRVKAWLTANVQGFPVLQHLDWRFCSSDVTGLAPRGAASEQPASATRHQAEPGSLPAAAALAHGDPAQHPATVADMAASKQITPESHALQPSRPPAIRAGAAAGHNTDTLPSAPSARAAANQTHASRSEKPDAASVLFQMSTFGSHMTQRVSHCNPIDSTPTRTVPTATSGSMAAKRQQAADYAQAAATPQVQVGSLATTAEAHVHGGRSSQTGQALLAQAQAQPAPLQSSFPQRSNGSQSGIAPCGLGTMPPASPDFHRTAGAMPSAVSAADHTNGVVHSVSGVAANSKHVNANPAGLDPPVYHGPFNLDHPVHDQQGSDSCTSEDEMLSAPHILRAPHRSAARAPSPPPGFEDVILHPVFEEQGSDSTSDDTSSCKAAAQYLPPHMAALPRTAASPPSPPPGFELVIPQPWLDPTGEAAAGPSQTSTNTEHSNDAEGCACDRWPRPDGSHRHITEKGKRRQKRRALRRKQARQAQHS